MKIAVVSTVYYPRSHTDAIVSRWIRPFPTDALYGWHSPASQIASIYVAQSPDHDISREMSALHHIPVFPTIAEALRLGGDTLAVDAILYIAEHGQYELNSWGQKLYPRKELFDEIVAVFRADDRTVPLFFDKHLSWHPAWILEMAGTIRRMNIPFFGGSSVPLSPLCPAGAVEQVVRDTREIVSVFFNCVESYLFHSSELAHAVIDRAHRPGLVLETTIAWQGAGVWEALDQGLFSLHLLEEAVRVVSPDAVDRLAALQQARDSSVHAFQLTYSDGLKVTHFMHPDLIRKWSLAASAGDAAPPVAAYADLGPKDHHFPHFARLNCAIESFFSSRRAPSSLDRLVLSSMATAWAMRALTQPGRLLQCPPIE